MKEFLVLLLVILITNFFFDWKNVRPYQVQGHYGRHYPIILLNILVITQCYMSVINCLVNYNSFLLSQRFVYMQLK